MNCCDNVTKLENVKNEQIPKKNFKMSNLVILKSEKHNLR